MLKKQLKKLKIHSTKQRNQSKKLKTLKLKPIRLKIKLQQNIKMQQLKQNPQKKLQRSQETQLKKQKMFQRKQEKLMKKLKKNQLGWSKYLKIFQVKQEEEVIQDLVRKVLGIQEKQLLKTKREKWKLVKLNLIKIYLML